MNVDFSAAPSGDFSANGPVVIGTKTFVVENFANLYAGATLGIVNGSGLKLGCQAALVDYPTERTTPLLRWSFDDTSILNDIPLRTCIYTGTSSGATGSIYLGLEYPDSSTRSNHWVKGTVATSATVFSTYDVGYSINNSVNTPVTGDPVAANTNILGLFSPEGVEAAFSAKPLPKVTSGIFANGDFTTMSQQITVNESLGSIAYGDISIPAMAQASNWGVSLSGSFASQNSGYRVYVRAIRVEAFY
jgi:hypothetical protein